MMSSRAASAIKTSKQGGVGKGQAGETQAGETQAGETAQLLRALALDPR